MEAEELDVALEELELRLERLRALYEQYFLGIEKLEPQIPRKDVDRRIQLLRRERVRNTGKRFKLQTLIQRYNTFQQYWGRICREIENGTYKRHIARAAKNIGPTELLTVAARRRFGKERERERASEAPTPSSRRRAAPSNAPTRPPSAAPPSERSGPPAGPRRTPTLRGISTPPPPGADVPISLRPLPPSPAPAEPRAAAHAPPPSTPARSRPSSKPVRPFESLELDMDFMGDWDPSAAVNRGRPKGGAPARPEPRAREATKPVPVVRPEPAQPAAHLPARAEQPGAERRLAPPPKPKRSAEAPPPAEEPPAPRFAATAAHLEKAPAAPAVQPSAAGEAARARAAARAAQGSPGAAGPAGGVSEARLKELHQKLLDANKGAGVSFDGLAKSLRATEAKLRAQHGANRKIDFDIVLKDGKPVVKPTVR